VEGLEVTPAANGAEEFIPAKETKLGTNHHPLPAYGPLQVFAAN
jgi:hypothetical protein